MTWTVVTTTLFTMHSGCADAYIYLIAQNGLHDAFVAPLDMAVAAGYNWEDFEQPDGLFGETFECERIVHT